MAKVWYFIVLWKQFWSLDNKRVTFLVTSDVYELVWYLKLVIRMYGSAKLLNRCFIIEWAMLVLSGGRDIYFKEIVFEGAYDKFASHFFCRGIINYHIFKATYKILNH